MKKLALLAATALLTTTAQASITQVFNVGALGAGPLKVENFEDGTFVSGISFTAPNGIQRMSSSSASSGVTTSGTMGLTTNTYGQAITMNFSTPASAIGLYFGNDDRCCSSGFTAYMDIFGTAGLLGTIGVAANMNDYVDQFLGFTSDQDVTRVTLRYGSGNVGLYHFIDDVTFGAAPSKIPEPTTLSMMAVALAGLGIARRKKA